MNLTPYIDRLQHDLALAAETGSEDVRAAAERLTASLDAAVRLVLLDALSAAADEVTRELAPGSVDLRLRSGEPEFVVTPAVPEGGGEEFRAAPPPAPAEEDDTAITRINLRLPEALKAAVEEAATRERLSTNAWLVRLVATAVGSPPRGLRPGTAGGRVGQSYTGWVR